MTVHWKRRLIPKWRVSTELPVVFGNDTRDSTGDELHAQDGVQESFKSALQDFELEPSIGTAVDAMRFATSDSFRANLKGVASFLEGSAPGLVPSRLHQIARDIVANQPHRSIGLTFDSPNHIANFDQLREAQRKRVKLLRDFLRDNPYNPLAWMDLARFKASLGDNEQAERCIQTSLGLAGDSRVVLRSAVRFYAHIDSIDRAHWLLLRSSRTQHDPWIMASEIAISSLNNKHSKNLKRARTLVDSGKFAAADIAELAGAIAVEEQASGGSRKVAKQLYTKSLIAPNDNALAQAQWAAKDLGLESMIDIRWLDNPASAEAALYQAMREGNIGRAVEKALAWHYDEPWATRPMCAASYLAAINGEFKTASHYARAVLVLEPENLDLLNNLAFSSACEGNLDEAMEALSKVRRLEGSRLEPHTMANMGFIAYIAGHHDLASEAYAKAIAWFEKSGKLDSAADARICQAMAATKVAASNAETLTREAQIAAKASKDLLVMQACENLIGPGKKSAQIASNSSESLLNWLGHEKDNILRLN